MSQENVEHRAPDLRGLERGDFDDASGRGPPDIAWRPCRHAPFAGRLTRRGRLSRNWVTELGGLDNFGVKLRDLRADDDVLVTRLSAAQARRRQRS